MLGSIEINELNFGEEFLPHQVYCSLLKVLQNKNTNKAELFLALSPWHHFKTTLYYIPAPCSVGGA